MALKVFGRNHVTFSLWGWNLAQKVKGNLCSCVNTNHEDIVRVFMENVNGMRKMLFSIYAHFVMIYRACCMKKLQKKLCFAWYQFYKFTFVFLMYETSFMSNTLRVLYARRIILSSDCPNILTLIIISLKLVSIPTSMSWQHSLHPRGSNFPTSWG